MAKVLIIDDDAQVRTMLRRTLEAAGHTTMEASNGIEGVRSFAHYPTDLVITDIYMPEKEGLETILELKRANPDLPIIAISGGAREADIDFLPVAQRMGADHALPKPVNRAELLGLVEQVALTMATPLESPAA